MAVVYTANEIKDIKEAYILLQRIFETNNNAEDTLIAGYKYEYRQRANQWTTYALIVREVYGRNKIKKQNLFSISEGIRNVVIASYQMFDNSTLYTKEKINKFNKAAKKSNLAQYNAIQRGLDAICSK